MGRLAVCAAGSCFQRGLPSFAGCVPDRYFEGMADRVYGVAVAVLTWVAFVGSDPLLDPWTCPATKALTSAAAVSELIDPWSVRHTPRTGIDEMEDRTRED